MHVYTPEIFFLFICQSWAQVDLHIYIYIYQYIQKTLKHKYWVTMDSSGILQLSQLSILLPSKFCNKKSTSKSAFYPFNGPWKKRVNRSTRLLCQKMYVPGFGEASPEAKAAKNLHNFFTYVAVKIVTAQLEDYNKEAYQELMEFLSKNSLNDGDKFIAKLMRESSRHQSLALRILEVRSAYCKNDFEWDNLQLLAAKMVSESNTKLMRDYVLETSHGDGKE